MIHTTRLFALIALAACGDNLPPPTPAPPNPPPPAPTRTITGTATLVTTDPAGDSATAEIGLHDTLVSAHFPHGTTWDVHPGISDAHGHFSIDDVPEGAYWLELYDVPSGNRQLLWTDASSLSFEEHTTGRPDAVPASSNTALTFGPMPGLDPVQADDGLQLTSGNLGLIVNLFGALAPAATSLDYTRAWTGEPLISGAAHDDVTLVQLRNATDASGIPYLSPIRSVTFDAIEQVDQATTHVIGTFTAPPDLAYDLHWDRPAFVAASVDGNPARIGPAAGQNFLFRAMPGGAQYGGSPFAAVVLGLDGTLFGDASELEHEFAIQNPYPASWLFNDFQMAFPITVPVPGVPDQSIELPAVMQLTTTELPTHDHPSEPLVSAPRAPTIDGRDLFADQEGVDLTPTVAWTAPAVGTPDAYVLTVEHWELQFAFADVGEIATLIVPGNVTSVRLPDHVLEAGEHYLIRIASLAQPGVDVRTRSLYTLGLPYGYADLVSNTFSVVTPNPE